MPHPTTDLEALLPPSDSVRLAFPDLEVEQDEEWFEFDDDGERRRLRLHDYAEIYERPGLYEALVYDRLKCRSPARVVGQLQQEIESQGGSIRDLRVMDLGAGNGVVGELLRRRGASEVVGIDILPEAARAARRDRPQVYDDYLVADLSESDEAVERRVRDFAPNCLVTVAALGFGDVPPEAFACAFNFMPPQGWLAMCIKKRFLAADDDSGFGRLIRGMIDDGTVATKRRETYVHRLSISGEELEYVTLIGTKERQARV